MAESADNLAASTKFDVDLGVQRTVSAFHFSNIRTAQTATIRIRAGTDNTFATNNYDLGAGSGGGPEYLSIHAGGHLSVHSGGSLLIHGAGSGGVTYVWPTATASPAIDQWGDSVNTGLYPAEEYAALGYHRFFVPPSPIACRYIRVEIFNSGSDPVQIGVFGAWECWQPPVNVSKGRSITVVDGSEATRVPGGSTYVVKRSVYQRHSFAFNFLADSELWSRALGVKLIHGQSSPTVIIPEPDDTTNLEKKSVYGVSSSAEQFTNPDYGIWQFPFQIDQLV